MNQRIALAIVLALSSTPVLADASFEHRVGTCLRDGHIDELQAAELFRATVGRPGAAMRHRQILARCPTAQQERGSEISQREPLTDRERRMIRGASASYAEYRTRRAKLEGLRDDARVADASSDD